MAKINIAKSHTWQKNKHCRKSHMAKNKHCKKSHVCHWNQWIWPLHGHSCPQVNSTLIPWTMFCFGFFVTCQLNKLTLSLYFKKNVPSLQIEKVFYWQFSTSSKKVSKLGNFLRKIPLESTVNNGEASIVIWCYNSDSR